jgi:peptidoglycan LD-endopeptidase CwlK
MITSRSIEDLSPEAKNLCITHVNLCKEQGIELLITSTYRDYEAQAALYAIGRTVDRGLPKVTDAAPGRSWHQYRCAWDIVPLVMGKCDWVSRDKTGRLTNRWALIVELADEAGVEAAAHWTEFREDAHFQFRPTIAGLHINLDDAKQRFDAYGTIFREV